MIAVENASSLPDSSRSFVEDDQEQLANQSSKCGSRCSREGQRYFAQPIEFAKRLLLDRFGHLRFDLLLYFLRLFVVVMTQFRLDGLQFLLQEILAGFYRWNRAPSWLWLNSSTSSWLARACDIVFQPLVGRFLPAVSVFPQPECSALPTKNQPTPGI